MHKTEDKRHYLKRLADTEKVIFQLQEKSNYLSEPERIALNRRIAQLTMDYLYNTIVLAQNYKHLEKISRDCMIKDCFRFLIKIHEEISDIYKSHQ